jgi:hypothetical protein
MEVKLIIALIAFFILIFMMFFRDTKQDKTHRRKLCELYGHLKTFDVLDTNSEGKYYIKCHRCARCEEQFPLDNKESN